MVQIGSHPLALGTLCLSLAACGLDGLGPMAAGQARTEERVEGTVTLVDSSLPAQRRGGPVAADGSFAVQVGGLTAPFLLRVEWAGAAGPRRLYAVSGGGENVDVNGITDAAYQRACAGEREEEVLLDSSAARKLEADLQARALLGALGQAVGPLLQRYGIADVRTARDAVRVLLQDVSVTRTDGWLVVANRQFDGVIFEGPIEDLASGTFQAGAMPLGPGIATCTAFTYGAYGACRPEGFQVRVVLASTPPGCAGGSPILERSCVYVPPGPVCASFTYAAYGACQPDGTQRRAVLTSRPVGCTGGAPITSRTCTYVAPIDGAALYAQLCAGCHGATKKGAKAATIQRAIDRNTGKMGTAALRALSPAQVAAISAAP